MKTRRLLLELFDAALRAVDGRARVQAAVDRLQPQGSVAIFAVGKAAGAMTQGARASLGGRITQTLLITKPGHVDSDLARAPGVTVIESGHPVPDERSLAAGVQLSARLANLAPQQLPLFLVSGGSSSLVEELNPGVTLDDLRALNQLGLAAGWDIGQFNLRRAQLSRLKGGGVARQLGGRRALALFISDVPGDDVDVIGSGLLGLDEGRPDAIERHVIANVELAVNAAVNAGAAHGLELEAGVRRFEGDAASVAADFLQCLRDTDADGLVWGGESTVTLPQVHGVGGRNTHLALAVARMLRPGEPLAILAAGTDGTDGPTADAGAMVDAESLDRATIAGCDVERAFSEFDSGSALEAAGDLVHTGPTGTNVGDILIGIKHSAAALRGHRAPRVL